MNDELSLEWPLRPSQAASLTHYLCLAMADIVNHEAGREMSRRSYLKLCGLSLAAELISREAAGWYGRLKGEDEELLEGLEERYLKIVTSGG